MFYISWFIYILDDTSDVPLIILWTVRTVSGVFNVLMIGVLMFWFKFEFGLGWFDMRMNGGTNGRTNGQEEMNEWVNGL